MKRARKQTGKPWGPEIARVVEIERIKSEAVIEALRRFEQWAANRRDEANERCKRVASNRDLENVSRGMYLAYSEAVRYLGQAKGRKK